MEITPHVNDSDQVRLELDNEISDVANPNFNGLGPSTTKRTVKTVVTVRDQQTIVIGGLIKDSVSETVEKVPLLGDIPILGYLFKRTSKTISKQNLLIILTPYIVKDPNDLRRIFERKIRERREFMERFSAFKDDRDYDAEVDYHRKRGLLEEINRTALEAEQEADELRDGGRARCARAISRAHRRPPVAPGAWPRAPSRQLQRRRCLVSTHCRCSAGTGVSGSEWRRASAAGRYRSGHGRRSVCRAGARARSGARRESAAKSAAGPAPIRRLPQRRGAGQRPAADAATGDHAVSTRTPGASETTLRDTAELAVTRPPDGRSMGQLLLRQTKLTVGQLDEGLAVQAKEGGRIGEVLVRRGFVTEDEVMHALGAQLDLAVAKEVRPEECDAELVKLVPINFAKQHRMIPLMRAGRAVEVAVADPLDVHGLDDVRRRLGAEIVTVLAPAASILEAINKVYARQEGGVELQNDDDEMGGAAEELVDMLDMTDEAPIIRWVNSVMFQAVKERASDIHIEPREKELIVRYRIDGNLQETKRANRNYVNSILSRVKIMAGLNIAEKRLPQDGRIRRKIAGKDIDMRVATAPGVNGERITIRLLDRSSVLHDLADIGFGEDHLVVINELIRRPHGIILVTGPTGSGKTTTLYACLAKINTPDLNILTVEDPVEYQLEGITQVPVNSKIDLTFASVLRSYLRHDPDVIMVGEIRDGETASMAIQASLTGHLVFSTIHTNDAAGAITRLVDMGIEPFLVASSLSGLLAQRLVRRLCPDCRVVYRPTDEELTKIGIDAAAFAVGHVRIPPLRSKYTPPPRGMLYRAREGGCPKCGKSGYRGRMGIYELLLLDNDIRQMALKNADSNAIKQTAVRGGMRTLRDDGAGKVLAGVTTIEEVLLVTTEDRR